MKRVLVRLVPLVLSLCCILMTACVPFSESASFNGNIPTGDQIIARQNSPDQAPDQAGTDVQDSILGSILDSALDSVLGSVGGGGGSITAAGRHHLKNFMTAKGKDYLKSKGKNYLAQKGKAFLASSAKDYLTAAGKDYITSEGFRRDMNGTLFLPGY